MAFSMQEFSLIDRYFSKLMGTAKPFLFDDGAVFSPDPEQEMVLASDTLIAGVHFRDDDPAGRIAQKALRTNLSDLAAMGATPLGYLLNISLPEHITEDWLQQFSDGLARDQKEFKIKLLGGDTTKIPGPLLISITVVGMVPAGEVLARRHAQVGDRIYVSGTLGNSALGLKILDGHFAELSQDAKTYFIDCYQLPEPRLALGEKLKGCAHAAIDVSDGLLADLKHICKAANVSAWVHLSALPVSSAFQELLNRSNNQRKHQLLDCILQGGDDYELVFTAPPSEAEHIAYLSQSLKLPITQIGHFGLQEGQGQANPIHLLNEDNQPIGTHFKGYQHTWR